MLYLQTFLFICFILVCCTFIWNKKEHFWFILTGIKICDNVIGLNRHDCKRCTNAGMCTTADGEQTCIPNL